MLGADTDEPLTMGGAHLHCYTLEYVQQSPEIWAATGVLPDEGGRSIAKKPTFPKARYIVMDDTS